jgi:putative spermidine/putrescine transport system substrate-binding protein
MLARALTIAFVCVCAFIVGCSRSSHSPQVDNLSWDDVISQAKGQTVKFAMWDGDPMINAYMREFVAPKLKSLYGVELQQIGGQGNELVSKLMVDLEAGRNAGDIDLMWINGETFYHLRKLNALYGPYTDRLPNSQFIDWQNPFIAYDFQQPVEGFECPWGNVQLTLIYNSKRVAEPPRTIQELADWVQHHPGRFTFDNSFTGMTFLKSLLCEFAGGKGALDGPFDDQKYGKASTQLWEYIGAMKPYLWRRGETFPESVAQLHQLMMNNEVDFTMSNNDGEVDNKAVQGIIPESSRAYVLESGTIRNSHYLGIPFNAPNKTAAMVLANFLISPEAQLEKAMPQIWGDGTVLDSKLLPEAWKQKFENIPGRERVAPRETLEKSAIMEPAPEIMVRLHEDFRIKIIESR